MSTVPAPPLNANPTRWVDDFRRRHGRSPRLLHIGNIANNAYLNAKALNAGGIESDVMCYDYYHIMGCPEWEDGEFQGEVRDQNFPDWSDVGLAHFDRPRWFAQGPMADCARYLIARRRGRRMAAWVHWHRLRLKRRWICKHRLRFRWWPGQQVRSAIAFAASIPARVGLALEQLAHRCPPDGALPALRLAALRLAFVVYVLIMLAAGVIFAVLLVPVAVARLMGFFRPSTPIPHAERATNLVEEFARDFPDRADQLTKEDLYLVVRQVPRLRELFDLYDGVVGYATDGVYPLATGKRPYLAYEHGTMREIPFEPTPVGRLCALTFRSADASMITNCDNIAAAGRLGLDNHVFVPHPVNESLEGDGGVDALRSQLRALLSARFLVFHPSRQHWESRRHPSWEKGNDFLIRGFARFVHEVAPDAGAVFVEWGQTVAESKELLESLGVADRVLWVPPLCNRSMIQHIQATEVLADQFYLGAFGSTTPKALLHGRPAMLYLDESRHEWCLPEMPPVINARSDDEVFEGLSELYRSPDFAEDLAKRGRAWYDTYHSNAVIVSRFSEALAECVV